MKEYLETQPMGAVRPRKDGTYTVIPRMRLGKVDAKLLAAVNRAVEQYDLPDGRRIHILGEGRLINLAAAEGHPASVMDMSFANQALAAEYMVKHHDELEAKVYSVP